MARHGLIVGLILLPFLAASCSPATPANSAPAQVPSIEHVQALMDHNLPDYALSKAIEILYHPQSTDHMKAEALYRMGRMAFDANEYERAMQDWQRLTQDYPRSERTAEVTQRIAQLYQAARARSAQ